MSVITGTHPLAEVWPIRDEVVEDLKESIRQNGLRHPIVVNYEGLILDGRTRYRACRELGIEPEAEVYDGDDVLEYIYDANGHRRHEPAGVRAMAFSMMLVHDGHRRDGRWAYGGLSENLKVLDSDSFRTMVAQAGVVLDFKPDLPPKVVSGEVPFSVAYEQAKAIKDSAERDKIMERERRKRERQEAEAEAARNAQIVADLTQAESKYLPLIESGEMTPSAAWVAHLDDTKVERERADQKRRAEQQQARNFCDLLARLTDFTHDNQRSWTRDCFANHGESLPEHYRSLHTPSTIRELGQALQTYAAELES